MFPQTCTFWRELKALWSLSQEDMDKFFESHKVMCQERITSKEDEKQVVDWYNVLNHFCALGNVEKMYIAPVLDPKLGNEGNQKLFEEKMSRMIGAGPGKKVLDLGCGKGRIANEVATYSGASLVGLNYDPTQIESAIEYAKERKAATGVNMEFVHGSFNDPLPFPDSSFDCSYEVGAFCYAIDKVKLFEEIFRVLKPGGKFSYCDWCRLKYNPNDPHHVDLLQQVKPLTGMVEMPFPKEVEEAIKKAGFEIEYSDEACVGGNQFPVVIQDTEKSFRVAETIVNGCESLGLLPKNFRKMWSRIRAGGKALKEAVELDLFTMSWHIVCRKPVTNGSH
jgi:sterol 24-C-methyltransferase